MSFNLPKFKSNGMSAKPKGEGGKKREPIDLEKWWKEWKGPIIAAVAAIVLVGLIPVCLYLAGFIDLMIAHKKPFKANLWSWVEQYMSGSGVLPSKSLMKSMALSLIATYVAIPGMVGILIFAGFRKKRELHGSARFATSGEVQKAKLVGDKGIIVGKWNGQPMKFPGQQFVLLAAPTRSGKGVGIVIPNCLSYEDSIVVLDLKQENFNKTAGYREKVMGQAVYLFNPFAEEVDGEGKAAPRSHRWNPLSSISKGVFRVGDILSIGNALWPSAVGEKDAFWNDNARNLFLAVVLFLSELADRRAAADSSLPDYPITMGEVLRQTSGRGSGKPVKEYFQSLLEQYTWVSSECRDAMSNFLASSDDVLSSILSTFNAPLTIFRNPIVDCATSASDFDIRDVRKKKMSIYLGIKPDQLPNASLLLNLFFSQLVNLNTKELPEDNPQLIYSCLLIMDEFTAMGKIIIVAKAVSYIAGYNLRLMPIIQSVAQLESVYGKEDTRTFVTNHAMQIVYAPREQKDAAEYSEMLGYFTEKSASLSRPKGMMGGKGGGPSESISDQRRALMLPQELKELGLWKEIVLMENTKPILCEKIKYFEDPQFTSRLMPAPPVKPMDIELFIAKTQNKVRQLNDEDVDFEHDTLKAPPGPADHLEIYEDAPVPPSSEPYDECIDEMMELMGVPKEAIVAARMSMKEFEEEDRNEARPELENNMVFSQEGMDEFFEDPAGTEREYAKSTAGRFEELPSAQV